MNVRHLFLLALTLLAPPFALAQGIISTVAGGNGFLEGVPATEARLDGPQALAVDAQGNAYIGDGIRIRRVDGITGIISTVAGSGNPTPVTDGQATGVALTNPQYFALDTNGNLAFLDGGRVMKLDFKSGTLATIAGAYLQTTSQLGIPSGLAADRAGNVYVTDDYYNMIYRIDALTNAVTPIAGNSGVSIATGDGGPAAQAGLARPSAIALDFTGNIFFVGADGLRRIDAQTGIIATIMPVSVNGASGDGGPVAKATLGNVTALAADSRGNLYIADGPRIRKIDWTAGTISTIAGSGQRQYGADGVAALQANFSFITGMSVDGGNDLWLADSGNARLFVIPAATGLIRTVAGTAANGDGGPALGALLGYASGIAVSASGNMYIDQFNQSSGTLSIRTVDPVTGFISTLAAAPGSGSVGGQLALDPVGNLLLAAVDRIVRIDTTSGTISTVAGGNGMGFRGDGGLATSAQMSPAAAAADASGNLYVADYWNYRIRRVDAGTGIVSTIAGNGGTPGANYDGATGPATQIAIGVPTGIAVSPSGDVYWTTPGRVLREDSNGGLSIAAGNGACFYAGDGGPALLASLCQPFGLAFDTDGNLFVGESTCGCVRRIDSVTGVIQTVAGTGAPGVSSDSIPATQAALNVGSVASAGSTLYIIDRVPESSNARIRAVVPAAPPALPQPPKISQVADTADFRNAYSPGALVSILGNYLAPPSPSSAEVGPDGRVTTTLAGDVVTFNGTAAPLLYVSAGRIDTVVPYSVPLGNAPVGLRTAAGQDTSNVFVTPTSLALVPGLVLNPDGSQNSIGNPAPKGATLVMSGTGMGQTNPAGIDGAILQGPSFPQPVAQFSATVLNGTTPIPAQISYLGPLGGAVAGTVQVQVVIPESVPAGQSSLLVGPSGAQPAAMETIYMLSDPPVLTSLDPPSPISQTVGSTVTLTLNGTNLNKIAAVQFFLEGNPITLHIFFQTCTVTSCTIAVDFAGQAGDYGVEVVDVARQVSNRLIFTVQPPSPPIVTGVGQPSTLAPLVATKGVQILQVDGANFQSSVSVDIFYNDSRIATVTSNPSPPPFLFVTFLRPTIFQMGFDFQGNSGSYGIEVIAPDGSRSTRFNFAVAAP